MLYSSEVEYGRDNTRLDGTCENGGTAVEAKLGSRSGREDGNDGKKRGALRVVRGVKEQSAGRGWG